MFDYKIIRIPISFWSGKPKEDYFNVIKEYAAKGWRFVQVFTPPGAGNGKNYYIEIIFEKPVEEI